MSRIIIVFYANETKKSEESTYAIGSIYKKLQKYVKKHDKILYIGEERIDFLLQKYENYRFFFSAKSLEENQDWNICENIELCGFSTDKEIFDCACKLKEKYPQKKITIDSQCCAGTSVEAHKKALRELSEKQIEIIEKVLICPYCGKTFVHENGPGSYCWHMAFACEKVKFERNPSVRDLAKHIILLGIELRSEELIEEYIDCMMHWENLTEEFRNKTATFAREWANYAREEHKGSFPLYYKLWQI